MSKECFCGCGREIPFGRVRATNAFARQVRKDVEMFKGAIEHDPGDDRALELTRLVREGEALIGPLREVMHGARERGDRDKSVERAWLNDASKQRKRLMLEVASEYESGPSGWHALESAQLLYSGKRAPARVVDVKDTGATINENPRVKIVFRVEPDEAEPFELERKLTVPRVGIPSRGEKVEVAYDPSDPESFTFRKDDLAGEAPPRAPEGDPLDKLAKLGELRDSGVLTQQEFEEQKRRVLES